MPTTDPKPKTKTFAITDFLTEAEIQRAVELGSREKILDEILLPNMDRINAALGQDNDARYLAYAVVHMLITAGYLTADAI